MSLAPAPRLRRTLRETLTRPGLWLALAAAAGGALFFIVRARGPEVTTCAPVRQDLEQHLVASGRVRVQSRIQIAAQSSGRVESVAVSEGQHVAAGDLLVQMDATEAEGECAAARAAVEEASARVDQSQQVGAVVAEGRLHEAQADLGQARAALARLERLAADGAATQVEFEDAEHTVALALAQQISADAQQSASAPAGADGRIAAAALLQARGHLAAAAARLAQTRLVAGRAALVLVRSVEPGDVVPSTRTLLVLAAEGDPMQLVFQSDERNLALLALGQPARVAADAAPQQEFDAAVSFIAPSIDATRGSIEVRLLCAAAPAFLKPDMTVSVDITVAARRHVLVVPSAVVHGATAPAPWLQVVVAGRVERRDVAVGLRGEELVEITAGLAETDAVVVPGGVAWASGQRVRPLAAAR